MMADAESGHRSIMEIPRWRLAVVLAGVGDSVATVLPLFVLVSVGQPVAIAAASFASYQFGALVGNTLVWGRLANRLRRPLALVIAGTLAQGLALIMFGSYRRSRRLFP